MTTILRQVPRDTVVHRLWAGTKLLGVAALGLTLSLVTSWAAIGLVGALVALTAALGRVGPGAVPRPRRWFWVVLGVGLLLAVPAGGSPEVALGGVTVGLGSFLVSLRLLVLTAVLLLAALLVGWTTPLGDVAPALARLGAPLRLLRLPVDEWAAATALCLRSLPLLAEEVRVLGAARRLRRGPGRRGLAQLNAELPELLTTAMATAMRRAGELGEAVTARGGWGRVSAEPGRPGWRDAVALALVLAVCAGVFRLG
ncbi:CbiQ family ECF transporter T component [Rhodococcus aerolatus]